MLKRIRGIKKDGWWLARRSLLAANVVVVILVVWGFAGEYLRHVQLQGEISRLTAEADQLEARNLEAAKLGRQFAADDEMEREARLKLGLRKPGESVIIVKDAEIVPPTATGEQAAQANESQTPAGNLRLWWRYFFGREG